MIWALREERDEPNAPSELVADVTDTYAIVRGQMHVSWLVTMWVTDTRRALRFPTWEAAVAFLMFVRIQGLVPVEVEK